MKENNEHPATAGTANPGTGASKTTKASRSKAGSTKAGAATAGDGKPRVPTSGAARPGTGPDRPPAGPPASPPALPDQPLEAIRVSTGADILAVIPHIVGYWPSNAVVCIGMAGPRLRATMRMDLPAAGTVSARRFADTAAHHLAVDGEADGALVAFFDDAEWAGPGDRPHAALFEAMLHAFGRAGIPVHDAWHVGPGHYRHYDCTEADPCGFPGRPNDEILGSRASAELVYRGSTVRDNPFDAVPELVKVADRAFARTVRSLLGPLRRDLLARGTDENQLAVTLAVWERALTHWPTPPDAATAAFLLASLGNVGVRDTVLVQFAQSPEAAFNGADAVRIVHRPSAGPVAPAGWDDVDAAAYAVPRPGQTPDAADLRDMHAGLYTEVVLGGAVDGPPRLAPDWPRLARAQALLLFLACSSGGPDKAPVLCMLGWIQWCKGRGTWAGVYFQAAQRYRPGYRLAELLERLLDAGVIAGWAKHPRTAWRGDPLGEEAA
ncbi:DUF4192 domain-containing protein [Specibacter cremeus]|uniref:DUF4192 domain-containing protein n=1 Tax=Specibacter cremeus TaxID=1629051 RepID=UPI000F77365D|nr:DUF4192 domain-containing protein [Specibacter cremeus]